MKNQDIYKKNICCFSAILLIDEVAGFSDIRFPGRKESYEMSAWRQFSVS